SSPLLDRAAARYAVMNLGLPVFGRSGDTLPLERSGEVLTAAVSDGSIRGFAITVDETTPLPADSLRADVHIEVRGPDGSAIADTYRRVWEFVPEGEMQIPLAGEDIEPGDRQV